MTFGKTFISQREYAAWQEVVRLLKKTGAVTEADGKSRLGSNGTDGEKLYTALNAWGEALVNLRSEVKP